MYLKSVEIIGFKSFADKMRVELKPGITGIVGPNGCGKSNVVESIRWCMGEGSWKSLRSQSMADVIFGGTSSRSPLSMAEVNLTFDNTVPLLPVDFTEVTVTRRIYRSGESEYFLNKVQCRRKDIQELFLDTGIGEEGYSIIDQGKVEMVLNSKPEDRRVLFEEAAGVSKFRAKRHEALLKLDRVELDMSRLNDTLAMILDQIKKLDSAARKARSYQKLKDELQGLEVAALVAEIAALDGAITTEETALAPLRDESQSLSSSVDAAEADLAALNLHKAAAENEVMEGATRLSAVKSELARLEERLKAAEHRLDEAKARQNAMQADHDVAVEQLSKPDPEVARLGEELAKFAQELEAAKAEAASFQTEIDAESEKLRVIEAEAAEADSRFLGLSEKVIAAGRLASQAQSEAAHMQASVRSLLKDIEKVEARRTEQSAKIEPARLAVTDTKAAHEKAAELYRLSEMRREWLQGAREQTAKRLGTAREKLAEAAARLDTAKASPQQFSGSAAQLVVEANLPGVLGRVSTLLRPEPAAVAPLREVLGERWNAVVCASFSDAQAAIEHLEHNGGGRCRFLVLESIPQDYRETAPPPVNSRRLLDLVHVDAPFEKMARFLLQETFLQGRTVHGPHWVVGGPEDVNAPAPLPDLAELSVAANTARTDEAALAAEEKQIITELAQVETECRALRTALADSDKAAHAAETLLKTVEGDVSYLEQEKTLIQNESQAELAKLAVTLEEQTRQQEAHEALAAEERALAETTRAVKQRLSDQKDAWNAKRYRGAELSGSVHKIEGTISYTHSQIDRREADRRALAANRDRLAEEIELTRQSQVDLNTLRDELNHEITASGAELAKEETRYRELMEALEQARIACTAKEAGIRELKERFEGLREEIHSLEIRLGQKRSQRDGVALRLQTDWSLSVEEAKVKAGERLPDLEAIANLRRRLDAMGPINMAAPEEYEELEKRHLFLKTQIEDLSKAREDLKSAIQKINATTRENFRQTFEEVRTQFKRLYGVLFEGGEADLVLTNPDDMLETGIDVVAQPPGKKLISISLMSGGEKAMTSAALLFSFFMVRPSPFCMLDEVDAALDESNVDRFVKLLKEFAQKSQFLIVSHNKKTMAVADVIYGVTMEEKGVSTMLSVEFAKGKTEKPSEPAKEQNA